MVLSFRFWALFDYWIFPTCHGQSPPLYQVGNMIVVFLGLENLQVPIVFILGNVLGLDEWHLPICYQYPPSSWENACTS
jgi:hypothetical protein